MEEYLEKLRLYNKGLKQKIEDFNEKIGPIEKAIEEIEGITFGERRLQGGLRNLKSEVAGNRSLVLSIQKELYDIFPELKSAEEINYKR